MPRENRKRGKKHKKQPEVQAVNTASQSEPEPELDETVQQEQPSWILSSTGQDDAQSSEAPFGLLDLDVKAYFKTVDLQIRDWQENPAELGNVEADANEDKRTFFMAALNEMQGKEKQLATDPECSVILERMLFSMDDFVRRVFVDSLTGSYEILARNRFASHVCQTLFATSRDGITRELKGNISEVPKSEDQGELRTLTQLMLDTCEELLPTIPTLVTDPFASHVVRSLLVLLCPNLEESEVSQLTVRSKKSRVWKARQGQMKSVFDDDRAIGKGKRQIHTSMSPEFSNAARRIVEAVKDGLEENEVRAMAANKVACPTLKMLLEVEADLDMANRTGSLMDRVTVGVISACLDGPADNVRESDYLGTLMRDANASHVLETIVSRSPPEALNILWSTYFEQSLSRLSVHPVANFVVAKALERISADQLIKAVEALKPIWKKHIQTSRAGVLRATVDRASALRISSNDFQEAVLRAFDIKKPDDQKLVVSCILAMLPLSEYKTAVSNSGAEQKTVKQDRYRKVDTVPDPLEPKIQGSLLLQSLLRLPQPSNQFIIDSVFALAVEDRIKITRNATGSRLFDVLLDSTSVPAKSKRQFVMDFIGHYHTLVDDKIGSRIGDRCWTFCDTYLKEKIARSLIPNEQDLVASFYGKFFARNLNLYLLQRRPEEWRNMQSSRMKTQRPKADSTLTSATTPEPSTEAVPISVKRKREARPDDEIDALFNETLGKRVKKAALGDIATKSKVESGKTKNKMGSKTDAEMQQVLGAIKAAPSAEHHHKKKP